MVETAGLDKFLLRKILMLCSALGSRKNNLQNIKISLPRLHSQTSPAKNGSLNRFINAVVRSGSASVRHLNKIKNPPAKPKDFYGGDGRT